MCRCAPAHWHFIHLYLSPFIVKTLLTFISVTSLVAMMTLTGCDDTTGTFGTSVMPEYDALVTTTKTYKMNSETQQMDSILGSTNTCYLGSVVDPETRAKTTCNFLAQFHVSENYSFPDRDKLILENDEIVIDSCDIRIYFDKYYGDSLTTMKLLVHELDTAKVMEEGQAYYTNINPQDYLNENSSQKASLTYAVKDLMRPTTETEGSSYYRSIRVPLSNDYGKFLLEKYYEQPNFFKNSYMFIHHVCPGFYFEVTGGVGSMVETFITTLNVYFKYHTINEAGKDTIVDGLQRMAATEEVLQNTKIENKLPASMLDSSKGYTYIKSPAGLYTEITLPIDEVIAGEHYNDTINSASFSLRCYNDETPNIYDLSAPPTILLIRKAEQYTFFEESKLTSTQAYISNYDQQTHAYTFSNVSQMIKKMKDDRDKECNVLPTDTEAQRKEKYQQWETEHPDWNKVILLPVKPEYSSSSSSLGGVNQTLMRIHNEFGMHSAKLQGGQQGIELSVIYSRFK